MSRSAASAPMETASPLPLSARRFSWNWLGIVPFILFAIAFIFLPSLNLFLGAFRTPQGAFTLEHLLALRQPFIMDAYWLSIRISAATALGGGLFGFMLAYAAILGGLPQGVRSALMTFSGVASNFAGVPLAFAFVATLGRVGLVTLFFKDVVGLDLYRQGFSLYSFWGLSLTYMYFQFPLMVLIISPALDGLRREWREAAENLGAKPWQYWRYVALPVLLPSLLGAMILLFGNAFGAYATAAALTGGSLNLAPVLIGAQIRGDVLHNPNLGYALALGMVVVMTITLAAYTWLRRRSSRWLREG
ncbi:MAG: ABC transporter permease subunit [Caldilineaceae bacterium]|nr:ABC transporter permease subunit [Caldilineaceae bacterium]